MMPDNSCPTCTNSEWIIKQRVNKGGLSSFPYCCKSCGYVSAICEKKEVVIDLIKKHSKLPEVFCNV